VTGKYILDDSGNPVEEPSLEAWAQWFETADRAVGKDTIEGVEVSTVFLGMDHGFMTSKPVLFETMIFGGEFDQFQWRDHTRTEAEQTHAVVVAALRDGRNPWDAVEGVSDAG
jgi:hypothetical protein